MKFISFEISLVAFLPALILCVYIYCKDRIEKEPIWLLCLLFGGGAAAYFPAYLLQNLISDGIDLLFVDAIRFSPSGLAEYSSPAAEVMHQALFAFLGLALVEIALKWCILYFGTRRNRHFNYLFDGIVYSTFISLGFSAAENIRFAWVNGWDTIVRKALSSTPCHLFVGILMGYFYTMWKAHQNAQRIEDDLVRRGVIADERMNKARHHLALSLIAPFFVSGTCIFANSINSRVVSAIFYFMVFSLYGFSFLSVNRIAAQDHSSKRFSLKLLQGKHPELDPAVLEKLPLADGQAEKEGEAE